MIRTAIINIDSVLNLFKDYAGQISIPPDAKPLKLMLHRQTRKLAILVTSEAWSGEQPMEEISFDIRRVFSVGNSLETNHLHTGEPTQAHDTLLPGENSPRCGTDGDGSESDSVPVDQPGVPD